MLELLCGSVCDDAQRTLPSVTSPVQWQNVTQIVPPIHTHTHTLRCKNLSDKGEDRLPSFSDGRRLACGRDRDGDRWIKIKLERKRWTFSDERVEQKGLCKETKYRVTDVNKQKEEKKELQHKKVDFPDQWGSNDLQPAKLALDLFLGGGVVCVVCRRRVIQLSQSWWRG